MRAAAFLSAAIVAAGIYLAAASVLSMSTTWIALGVLTIAVTAAVALMTASENGPAPL